MEEDVQSAIEHWKGSRAGAWAGRGFHYQHLVSTLILIRQWAGLAPLGFMVPEGLDDCVVELADRNLWLQIKSRKNKNFNNAEVLKFLAATRAKASAVRSLKENHAAVILEHPRAGRSEAGVDQISAGEIPSVLTCAAPAEEGLKLQSKNLDTAEAIADGIFSDLYRMVAEASQENASLPFEQRRRISTTEVERSIFERMEAEDPSTIDGAMATGALEPVDFNSPFNEPAFYQGVKVKAGHVAAALVLNRPGDTDLVVRTLRRRRHVLISGPSGAGKSALMWLSATLLDGELRWYQITSRVVASDADLIIRFMRARRPTEASPIGLLFDDVGSANSDLWDVLVRELRGMPSIYFLGSMRREDSSLIANQSDTEFIHVSLDEDLANSIWQRLRIEKQTSWRHWREPFELSENLMLEYVHVLTQGQRLQAVIDEQVRQRLHEKRFDELALIRITAVICSRGGEVQASKLFELLDLRADDASLALTRLLDEHLSAFKIIEGTSFTLIEGRCPVA